MSSLIERLKDARDQCTECCMFETAQDFNDAVIALEAANARIAELEADLSFQTQVTDAARQHQAELLERAEAAEARIAELSEECDKKSLRIAEQQSLMGLLRNQNDAAFANVPGCVECGDAITTHDPGVCGNCFAMKYRDSSTAKDAEILRTLIYRAHAVDLKFDNGGNVSALVATFKSKTEPSIGMSEGVRNYLDAFMADAALAKQQDQT
jgi:small-conductance mechanosensitive channel